MTPESPSVTSLDRSAGTPIWFQLMRVLESDISAGVWVAGDRLPSENELCTTYGISRTSVREALSRLEQSGIITRRQGAGAFVATTDGPWSWTLPSTVSLLGQYRDGDRSALTSRLLRANVEQLPPWAAAGFSDSDGGLGTVLERVRSVGKLTAVHVVNYLPKRLSGVIPSLRDPRASLYAELEKVARVTISRMHRMVEAISADRRLAHLLELEEGHPVVVVEAVAYDQNGQPVDFSRAAVRTDRLRVTVDSSADVVHPSGLYPGHDGSARTFPVTLTTPESESPA